MSLSGPDDVFLSTSLASYLDKKLLVLLRDGRKLLGILRSFDQFANAVLEGACERVIVGDLYCDIPLGLYVIRGENVVLIGELELDRKELPDHMISVSAAEIKKEMGARVFFVVVMGAQPLSPHASLGEIQLSLDLWVSSHVRTIIWLSTTSEMEPEIIMRRAKHRKQRGMPQI